MKVNLITICHSNKEKLLLISNKTIKKLYLKIFPHLKSKEKVETNEININQIKYLASKKPKTVFL